MSFITLNEHYADEARSYAIGFAKWLCKSYHPDAQFENRWVSLADSQIYSSEHLYEIYIQHLNEQWQTKK